MIELLTEGLHKCFMFDNAAILANVDGYGEFFWGAEVCCFCLADFSFLTLSFSLFFSLILQRRF